MENCTRCGRKITGKLVQLELSNTDGKYYKELPEGHESQGWFYFGETCSKLEDE